MGYCFRGRLVFTRTTRGWWPGVTLDAIEKVTELEHWKIRSVAWKRAKMHWTNARKKVAARENGAGKKSGTTFEFFCVKSTRFCAINCTRSLERAFNTLQR